MQKTTLASPLGGESSKIPSVASAGTENDLNKKYFILKEGWLSKKADRGIPTLRKWNHRYCVLYLYTAEIRLYANMQTSNFGNVFLDERQSLPIEQIMSVQVASNTKYEGKRIDIHTCCAHIKYPRLALDNNGQQGVSSQNYKQDYSFRAPSPEEANEWYQAIIQAREYVADVFDQTEKSDPSDEG